MSSFPNLSVSLSKNWRLPIRHACQHNGKKSSVSGSLMSASVSSEVRPRQTNGISEITKGADGASQYRRHQLKSFNHAAPFFISSRISTIVRFRINASGRDSGVIDLTLTLLPSGKTSSTIQAFAFFHSACLCSKNRSDLARII